jgi:hypothetical protein
VVEFYYRLIRNADYLVSAQHNSSEEGSGTSSDVEGSADSHSMDISDESALFEVILVLQKLRKNSYLIPGFLSNALIKKKMKFSSYIRKFRGIGCKAIYD